MMQIDQTIYLLLNTILVDLRDSQSSIEEARAGARVMARKCQPEKENSALHVEK